MIRAREGYEPLLGTNARLRYTHCTVTTSVLSRGMCVNGAFHRFMTQSVSGLIERCLHHAALRDSYGTSKYTWPVLS